MDIHDLCSVCTAAGGLAIAAGSMLQASQEVGHRKCGETGSTQVLRGESRSQPLAKLPAVCDASQDEDSRALRTEQLSRIRQFFGEKRQRKLEDSYVVVVGLGGVGSHAAHMLARSGVRKLRLIDFDNVTLSSLNRHAVATRRDVGIPKVEACSSHFKEIAPFVAVDAVTRMFRGDAADELLTGEDQLDDTDAGAGTGAGTGTGAVAVAIGVEGRGGAPTSKSSLPDLVLDCIDDTPTKADLVLACHRLRLPLVCALGAGGKCDPTRVHISNLDNTIVDSLATQLRYRLRLGLRKAEYFASLPPAERERVMGCLDRQEPPFPGGAFASVTANGADSGPVASDTSSGHVDGDGGGEREGEGEGGVDGDGDGNEFMSSKRGTKKDKKEKEKKKRKKKRKTSETVHPEEEQGDFWLPLAAELSPGYSKQYDEILSSTSVVYTSEEPSVGLMPLTKAQAEAPGDFGAVGGMRLRVMPVLGTLPALLGMAVATHALCQLAGRPIPAPLQLPRPSKGNITKVFHRLTHRERTVHGMDKPELVDDVSMPVVEHLMTSVWKGRCAVTGRRHGSKQGGILLVRWRPELGPSRLNWVLMADQCAQELQEKGADHAFDEDIRSKIEARLAWARWAEEQGHGLDVGRGLGRRESTGVVESGTSLKDASTLGHGHGHVDGHADGEESGGLSGWMGQAVGPGIIGLGGAMVIGGIVGMVLTRRNSSKGSLGSR